MLGKSFASPLLTLDFAARFSFFSADLATAAPNNLNFTNGIVPNALAATKKWELHSTAQAAGSISLSDEDRKAWEACKQALSVFEFGAEEEDKILGKAFGYVHSPYWSEERKTEVPQYEIVIEKLEYLRRLDLSDDDVRKLLKKFPEVLGCSLEEELRKNVEVLAKEWGIEGKSLRNLLLRNPKVLGFNVDCRGDCMAQCTRCWVRF